MGLCNAGLSEACDSQWLTYGPPSSALGCLLVTVKVDKQFYRLALKDQHHTRGKYESRLTYILGLPLSELPLVFLSVRNIRERLKNVGGR